MGYRGKIHRTVDAGRQAAAYLAVMETTTATQSFLDHLTARNFEELAGTLAPDAVARLLLPRGPDLTAGAEAIAQRLEGWFGAADRFTVLATSDEQVGRRRLMHWKFRLCRDGETVEVIEQVAFADVGPNGISRLDLVCSGFLPD
jgi:hypothetical protein